MIESGKSEPSLKVLKAFADKLGVAVEDLLGETALDPGDLSEAHVQILTALNYLSDEQAEILLNVMKALGMIWE
jgi:transcriptional regulator with XRE-family HTH domain